VHPMSKVASLYGSSSLFWIISFIQARQETTNTSEAVALLTGVAAILTALGTIIAMLNKSREGGVGELTALLQLERQKIQQLEKANRKLSKRVQELEERLAKTAPVSMRRASRKSK